MKDTYFLIGALFAIGLFIGESHQKPERRLGPAEMVISAVLSVLLWPIYIGIVIGSIPNKQEKHE